MQLQRAEQDLTAWGGCGVTLDTSALTPSLPITCRGYHSGSLLMVLEILPRIWPVLTLLPAP